MKNKILIPLVLLSVLCVGGCGSKNGTVESWQNAETLGEIKENVEAGQTVDYEDTDFDFFINQFVEINEPNKENGLNAAIIKKVYNSVMPLEYQMGEITCNEGEFETYSCDIGKEMRCSFVLDEGDLTSGNALFTCNDKVSEDDAYAFATAYLYSTSPNLSKYKLDKYIAAFYNTEMGSSFSCEVNGRKTIFEKSLNKEKYMVLKISFNSASSEITENVK